MYYLENILCSFYRYYKEKPCKLKKCFKDNYGIKSRNVFYIYNFIINNCISCWYIYLPVYQTGFGIYGADIKKKWVKAANI